MKRITKSNDPVLAELRERLGTALMVGSNASLEQWDEAIEEIRRARHDLNERAAMFRPRRIKKAERKAPATMLRQLYRAPFSRVPQYMKFAEQEASIGRYYINALVCNDVAPDLVNEFKHAARNQIHWASLARAQAARAGRRLP